MIYERKQLRPIEIMIWLGFHKEIRGSAWNEIMIMEWFQFNEIDY